MCPRVTIFAIFLKNCWIFLELYFSSTIIWIYRKTYPKLDTKLSKSFWEISQNNNDEWTHFCSSTKNDLMRTHFFSDIRQSSSHKTSMSCSPFWTHKHCKILYNFYYLKSRNKIRNSMNALLNKMGIWHLKFYVWLFIRY